MPEKQKTYEERFHDALDEQFAWLQKAHKTSDDQTWATMRATFVENLELSEGTDQDAYWRAAIKYCDQRLTREFPR